MGSNTTYACSNLSGYFLFNCCHSTPEKPSTLLSENEGYLLSELGNWLLTTPLASESFSKGYGCLNHTEKKKKFFKAVSFVVSSLKIGWQRDGGISSRSREESVATVTNEPFRCICLDCDFWEIFPPFVLLCVGVGVGGGGIFRLCNMEPDSLLPESTGLHEIAIPFTFSYCKQPRACWLC